MSENVKIRSTTVVAVKRNGHVAMAGDGQVTAGNTVVKGNARKVRRIYDGKVLTGFAGSVADAFTLFDKFEEKLKEYNGDLTRSAVELAKLWRTERAYQKLEAMLLVANSERILLISGDGNVIEPENDVCAIGSGLGFAVAIILMASLREKLVYANVPKPLQGIGIAFILAGMLSLAFMGFAGMV